MSVAWPNISAASPGRSSTDSISSSTCPRFSAADLMTPPAREGSAEVAARVGAARKIQLARYGELGLEGVVCNAVEEIAEADASGLALLRDAAERLRLSARRYHRVLKLARTLADLDGGGPTRRAHLAEALSYRGAPDRAAAAA
jgi:magnesium chelatase family protein